MAAHRRAGFLQRALRRFRSLSGLGNSLIPLPIISPSAQKLLIAFTGPTKTLDQALVHWNQLVPQAASLADLTVEAENELPDADTGQDAAEQPITWFFTFGAEIPALQHRYVKIHGTFMESRHRMLAIYSHRWCAQYASAEDAGVQKYHLTELVLPSAPGDIDGN